MPTYRYKCPSCEHLFDVTKGVSEIDSLESCPTCGTGSIEGKYRIIEPRQFYGEKPDDPFYSIPLGKMVSSKKELRSEAKARGWEEVGNSVPDIEKHIENDQKAIEKKCNARWEELMRG
jgi:putative FmdB family regulatory protein